MDEQIVEVEEIDRRRHEYEKAVLKAAHDRAEALRLKKLADRVYSTVMASIGNKPVNQKSIEADISPEYVTADKDATKAEYTSIKSQALVDIETMHIKCLCMIASCKKNERNFQ